MTEALSTPLPVRERTRVDLLETAERLFATYGIDAVSLRQITSAAGHRNPAAVQYHFGSKQGLLKAIVEYRLPPLNRRRLELLDRLQSAPRAEHIRLIVEAIIRPLVELAPLGGHYIQFLAEFTAHHGHMNEVFASFPDDLGLGGQLAAQALKDALDDLPDSIRQTRATVAIDLLVTAVATRQRSLADGVAPVVSDDEFVHDLINGTVGYLTAPYTAP